ncbi:hypothetical protein BD311DRAFT_761250 [Dichomitus squalens]|uniref:G-patch domain-containing protein n=1 Tax=Dichomitus squalens TaxID=114155 RepID=A0A4Q9ML98_9APHY|nr:hypothetical protein BD311DRAFT_761250 [Dichomitus squalens]
MATVTHYIYSHSDPPNQKEDEEVVQEQAEEDQRDPWLTESTFGVNRRLKNAPRFVPAIVSYDEVNNMMGSASSSLPRAEEPAPSSHVGEWYRSLPRASSAPVIGPQASPPARVDPSSSSSSQPTLDVPPAQTLVAPPSEKKNDWFTTRSIMSAPSSLHVTPVPAPTLADILSREPPPERKEQPFVPPVFLHIGPSNKGFAMLQQSGWSEGEALGAAAPRRSLTQNAREKRPARTILDDRELSIKTEELEVAVGTDDDIREVRHVDVVDLTLSDSDEESSDVETDVRRGVGLPDSSAAAVSHNPKALLTPLATVLKTDRLGIGLKAKTVGPFKESKKRVTHNQAALAAHAKANEDMRMRKALFGRGARSFARIAKAEAESRKRLLASLNE